MKKALVIGHRGGIGAALAAALDTKGFAVTGLGRAEGFDLTQPDTIAASLGALDGPFDVVVMATGILAPPGGQPEKRLAAVTADGMAQVMAVNAIGPALVLGQVARLLPKASRAVVMVLSARVGSIGDNDLGGWHSYRASKAALNMILRGAAIEMVRSHPQAICVALHPGTVATPFTAGYAGRHPTVAPEVAAEHLLAVIDGLTPADTGSFRDWRGDVVAW